MPAEILSLLHTVLACVLCVPVFVFLLLRWFK